MRLRRPARARGRAIGGVAAAAAAAVLGACGGEADSSATADAGTSVLGSRPGKLTCTDWQDGTVSERLGTIEQLAAVASGNANPEDVGPNRTLPSEDAYDLLEGMCSSHITRGFLLYEIYNRSAAFSPGAEGG